MTGPERNPDGVELIQGIPVTELAGQYGTPFYAYDAGVLAETFDTLRELLPRRLEIFYSLKSNPNVAVCALLARRGARAEVSSLVELRTALRAGVSPNDIIFLGPGKSPEELAACLEAGVHSVVCESFGEIATLDRLAHGLGVTAPVSLRVNPEFSVKGSGLTMGGKPRQFGIDEAQLLGREDLAKQYPSVRLMGIHAYMGTRILDEEVVARNTAYILDMAERLADRLGFPLDLVDVGGGLGVAYFAGERDLDPRRLAELTNPVVEAFARRHPGTRMIMELGRYLTGRCGTYVVRVRDVKTSMDENFAVTDGGTHHHMAAVGIGSFVKRNFPVELLSRVSDDAAAAWNVTGPLCTPNDVLAKKAELPPLRPGDLLGVRRSGAYGPSASPVLFLSHGHPAEIVVHEGRSHLVRERDLPEDLMRKQRLPDFARPETAETAAP
ncbi:type III PLP-dependent enzyme [Streptomyces sp. NBC_00525]|uniref:type III PLP-dependent enzyme n=1 Tax=Streptomyces sp. NBC_00525 TaxID=2903660 RepID=UPI002E7FF5FE|nr:type III PLP-dependent enzyme [Streptomyces sp. NBC_00525]WUC96306.1 type III PLP-dependent enzyme [Streptomyces sp. NBC_00525]